MDVISLIPNQLFGLIAALYVLGMIFKNSSYMDNELIPLMLLSIGIVISISILGFTSEAIIQGILCTGVSIGINQTIKQIDKVKGE